MNTVQICYRAKTTKRKARTRRGRLEAFEAGIQIAHSHTAARLMKKGWWNPYAATGSTVVIYRRGEEPPLPIKLCQ